MWYYEKSSNQNSVNWIRWNSSNYNLIELQTCPTNAHIKLQTRRTMSYELQTRQTPNLTNQPSKACFPLPNPAGHVSTSSIPINAPFNPWGSGISLLILTPDKFVVQQNHSFDEFLVWQVRSSTSL